MKNLTNDVFPIGNGPRIAREIGSLAYFFPRKGSNEIIRNCLSHIHAVPPLFVRYLPIYIISHHYYWHLTDPHRAIFLPSPRLRVFFQLSQDLIAIDQEVAASLREWSLQTAGNVGLLHKFTLWQMENPELNRGL